MTTRDIRPSTAITVCDVCGRTLLRGERAEAYIHGGARRWVCELCKSRALHEGWVREGTDPSYDGASAGPERRRSLLGRLRGRREGRGNSSDTRSSRELDEELAPPRRPPAGGPSPLRFRHRRSDGARTRRERVREPRHVRAIPTSTEQKAASAVELFNSSEHTRTVAGVARSLGASDGRRHPLRRAREPRQRRRFVGALLVPLRGRPQRRGAERPRRGPGLRARGADRRGASSPTRSRTTAGCSRSTVDVALDARWTKV